MMNEAVHQAVDLSLDGAVGEASYDAVNPAISQCVEEAVDWVVYDGVCDVVYQAMTAFVKLGPPHLGMNRYLAVVENKPIDTLSEWVVPHGSSKVEAVK